LAFAYTAHLTFTRAVRTTNVQKCHGGSYKVQNCGISYTDY